MTAAAGYLDREDEEEERGGKKKKNEDNTSDKRKVHGVQPGVSVSRAAYVPCTDATIAAETASTLNLNIYYYLFQFLVEDF